jgi:membrane-associated phospholipid phosphatase
MLIAVYALAVHTPTGQLFEDDVLRAADAIAGSAEQTDALNTLDVISVPTVVAAILIIFLIGAVRRRFLLAALAVAAIAAAMVTAELIQRYGSRPILLSHGYRREDMSFPSGHTTTAVALMCGLALVVPYRVRGLAVAVSSLFAAGVGVATVTASWHRPSDTIGADLIVVGFACAAVAVLARCDRVRPAALPARPGRASRALLTAVFAGVAVVSLVVAAVALYGADRSDGGSAMLLAGRLLALSGCASVATALLALLRHVDLGARPEVVSEEGNPDVASRPAGVDRPAGP